MEEFNISVVDSDLAIDEVTVVTQTEEASERTENSGEKDVDKLIKLPLSRIKHIMKLDPDLTLASQESVVVVAKATELFIESLTREAYSFTAKGKKKTVQKRDLDAAIETIDALCFLEGTLD